MVWKNIWDMLHVLTGGLLLMKFYIFYTSKDGIIRKIFMMMSLVVAYHFIFTVIFDKIGINYEWSEALTTIPVFIVMLICLFLLRRYSEQHKKETNLVKHELDKKEK